MHDWQSADVIDLLTTQMMTDLYEWRHDRGRALRGADDSADLRRAIVFAGQKLDAFQMARFLEDSRLWPADQQLVLKLQYAAKERDRIVAKLNEPPAPERIEGATEVAIGVVFWEKAMEYMVTAGPDHNGNWTVEHIATKQVYANIDTGLIRRRLDEARNAAQALQSQPNVQARPANWPLLSAPYVGLMFLNNSGDIIEVMSGPDTSGECVIKNHSNQIQRRASAVSIMTTYHQCGPAPGHTVPGSQPQGGAPVHGVVVSAGLRFKDYVGGEWTVVGRSGPTRWGIENRAGTRTDTMSEKNIQERYKNAGTW